MKKTIAQEADNQPRFFSQDGAEMKRLCGSLYIGGTNGPDEHRSNGPGDFWLGTRHVIDLVRPNVTSKYALNARHDGQDDWQRYRYADATPTES